MHIFRGSTLRRRATKLIIKGFVSEASVFGVAQLEEEAANGDDPTYKDDGYDNSQPGCSKHANNSMVILKETCPICLNLFPKADLQEHAQTCAERKFDILPYSSDQEEEEAPEGEF